MKNQKGAASIEFVFVFIVFFMLFYGMVSLTFPLLLSATYEELSAEALREAITLRSHSTKSGEINLAVNSVIADSWLPNNWRQVCDGYGNSFFKKNGSEWSVCIAHNKPSSIIPQISLLGLDIIKLPETISGKAVIAFNQ
ncbi:MAG: pilus assembly protein [Pseudomonas sp.]|nr:pilus assembly protein [Pseudomonas sp.]